MLYRFVDEQKADGVPVERICAVAGVSTSAYFGWKQHRNGVSSVAELEEVTPLGGIPQGCSSKFLTLGRVGR